MFGTGIDLCRLSQPSGCLCFLALGKGCLFQGERENFFFCSLSSWKLLFIFLEKHMLEDHMGKMLSKQVKTVRNLEVYHVGL